MQNRSFFTRTPQRMLENRRYSLIVPTGGTHVSQRISSAVSFKNLVFAMITGFLDENHLIGSSHNMCFPIGPYHVASTAHNLVHPPYTLNRIEIEDLVTNPIPRKLQPPGVLPTEADIEQDENDVAILKLADGCAPFTKWLLPRAPVQGKDVISPCTVPNPTEVGSKMARLIEAWEDQGVDVKNDQEVIETFFKHLGKPGRMVTLKGSIAKFDDQHILHIRISSWPGQSGVPTCQEDETFCAILQGYSKQVPDKTSNFNQGVAVTSPKFLTLYNEHVVPTLPTLPDYVKDLLK